MKAIVATTIYNISPAIIKFASFKEWKLYIVGDLKTPHDEYITLDNQNENVFYMSPKYQEKHYEELSNLIGWNSIQRRNLGFLEALKDGAEIIASVDDDNIPFDNWGKNILIGKEVSIYYYETENIAFDSVGATNYKHLWHRGFPIQNLYKRNDNVKITIKTIKPDIQADFWNGDPDIDAVCRLEHKPMCFFDDKYFPIGTNTFTPFNSQNTFFSREAMKKYLVIPYPGVGRMDDIWPSYYLQSLGFKVIFNKASVFQDRNIQNLTKNLTMEYIGYENTIQLLEGLKENSENYFNFLPKESTYFVKKYFEYIDKLN
jgi:hypothetical protein